MAGTEDLLEPLSGAAFIWRATADTSGSEASGKDPEYRQEVASGQDRWCPASVPPLHKAPGQGCSGHCALFYEAGGL